MHNKFCVIDDKIVINGSYNWAYYAEDKNRENVLIIKDERAVLEDFAAEYERLKSLTNLADSIRVLTKFEVDEFNQLKARDYLANDIIYQAKETGRRNIVEEAFRIAPANIEVQQRAVDLSLAKKRRLKYAIGTSLNHNRYLIIVPKGAFLPFSDVKIVQTAEDNQRSSSATIHYGDNPSANYNKQFSEIELTGLPPKPAGEVKIKYVISVDIYGVLQLEKLSLDNGRRRLVTEKITGLIEEVTE